MLSESIPSAPAVFQGFSLCTLSGASWGREMSKNRAGRRSTLAALVVGVMTAAVIGVGGSSASAEPAPEKQAAGSAKPKPKSTPKPKTEKMHGNGKVFDV